MAGKTKLIMLNINQVRSFFFIILFTLSTHIDAQEVKLPINQKGRLHLENGMSLSFKKLSKVNDSIVCHTSYVNKIYSFDDVYKIEVKKNRIPEMTLLFTGLGILTGMAYASVWDEEALQADKSTAYAITVPIFALGGIITGALITRYKTIYQKNTKSISLNVYSEYNKCHHFSHLGIKIRILIN